MNCESGTTYLPLLSLVPELRQSFQAEDEDGDDDDQDADDGDDAGSAG